MRVFVQAKPRSKNQQVEAIDETHFIIRVKEPAEAGRANQAIASALAKFMGVPPSRVRLVSGHAARKKIFEVSPKPGDP